MRSTRILPTAATALALILVAGCGSSGSAASTGSSAAASTSPSISPSISPSPGPSTGAPTSASDAASAAASTVPSSSQELRDVRYCEVIPAITDGNTVYSTVYNTLGYNNCPERQWKDLTEDIVNSEFGSQSSQLNGPRHWVIDYAQQPSAPAPVNGVPTTFTFGGIETGIRGQLATPVGTPLVGNQDYVVNTVKRNTVWTYLQGTMVYQLTDPDGNVYVMQSYSTQVNPALSLPELPTLAQTLSLPTGWTFTTQTLDQQLNLVTGGTAYVVNDDFANSYQKRTDLDTTGPTG